MTTNQQAKQQREAIGEAATAILAYLDMGNQAEVERLLYTTEGTSLGLIITTWYQICVAHRGPTVIARTARRTADFLQKQAEAYEDTPEAAADRYSAALMVHLADNKMDQYAKTWNEVVSHQPGISADVAARMLGFIRGVIGEVPEADCD